MKNRHTSGKTDKKAIEYVGLDKLTPYARNSRTHSSEQVKQIAASIREFGFTNPVLIDDEGTIIAGHGRVLAAQHLQLPEVPCIRLGYLTETQRRAYVIADNKLALNADWDVDLLQLTIKELSDEQYDIALLGFNASELAQVIDPVDRTFDTYDLSEQDTDADKEPTKTTDGYAEFAIVLAIENKQRLLRRLNEVKRENNMATNEDALMWIVGNE